MFNRIKIINFPTWVAPHTLYSIFSPFGKVLHIRGFLGTSSVEVIYEHETYAKCAISSLQGISFAGISLQMVLVRQGPPSNLTIKPISLSPSCLLAPPLTPSSTITSATSSPCISPIPSPPGSCTLLYSPNAVELHTPPLASQGQLVGPHRARTPAQFHEAQVWQPKQVGPPILLAPASPSLWTNRTRSLPLLKSNNTVKTQEAAGKRSNCTNVYILNLSLDVDNEELKTVCEAYGEVKHVCVLATLDHAGRRRAFVDMATPIQAQGLISGLTRTRLHGYELHASFAFVQRSGGPNLTATAKPFNPRRFGHDDSLGVGVRLNEVNVAQHQREPKEQQDGIVHIKVSGLSPHVFIDDNDFVKLFRDCGIHVLKCRLTVCQDSGISSGHGFVEVKTGRSPSLGVAHDAVMDDAEKVMKLVDGMLVAGERISCLLDKKIVS